MRWWHFDLGSLQQLFNRQDFDLGKVAVPSRQAVEACRHCFGRHILRRRFQRDEHAHRGLLALHRADEIPNVAAFDVAAFHLHQHALGLRARVVNKVNHAVDPLDHTHQHAAPVASVIH